MSNAFHLAEAASKLLKLNPNNFHGVSFFELNTKLFGYIHLHAKLILLIPESIISFLSRWDKISVAYQLLHVHSWN